MDCCEDYEVDEVKGFYLFVFYTVLGDTYVVKGNNMVNYFMFFWGIKLGLGGGRWRWIVVRIM